MNTAYWISTICHMFYLEISCIILFNPPNTHARWLLVSLLYWEPESVKCLTNVTLIASSKSASHLKVLLEWERVWKNEWLHGRVGMWTIVGLTPSMLVLDLITSLSGWGCCCFLMYSPGTWHPPSLLSYSKGYRTFRRVYEISMTPTPHLQI